jgi:hypothetical protein
MQESQIDPARLSPLARKVFLAELLTAAQNPDPIAATHRAAMMYEALLALDAGNAGMVEGHIREAGFPHTFTPRDELPADLRAGFAAEDDTEPDATPAPLPVVAHADHPDLATLTTILNTLSPTRSYAGHRGPNWERERALHLHHALGHALGAVAGRVLVLGSRALGRHLGEHTRRTLAHALHGAAHAVHPHADGAQG